MFKAILLIFSLLCFALPSLAQVVNNNPSQASLDANDNNVLKFALTLENLEATFYAQFNGQFDADAFTNAGYSADVRTNFVLIAAQEASHVTLLNSVLTQRTGSGLAACTYNFSLITNVTQYVAAARLFENVGTFAYDGAIDSIYNRTLQQAAATIATVEGRHAAYLNTLPGELGIPGAITQTSPFPNSFEPAAQPNTVAGLIAPFITTCPYDVSAVIPTVLIVVPVPAPNTSAPQNPTSAQVTANDVAAFNFALALEYLEATFYNQFMSQYTVGDFTGNGLTSLDFDYFNLIRDHENAHVNYLVDTIKNLPATPAVNCTYNFAAVTNFSTFIGTAKLLENTGVSAYNGAVNTIFTPAFREAAATVATVEARHAAYLNQLQGDSPFPNTTDPATPPATIIAVVAANFITGACNITAPQSLVITPYNTSTTPSPTNPPTNPPTASPTASPPTTSPSTTSSASSLSAVFALVVLSLVAALW